MSEALPDRVFDAGLQLERTALAWQRTLLSVAVGSLAASRGLEYLIGAPAWGFAALGLGSVVVMSVVVRRRYLRAHRHLISVDPSSMPGGAILVALCAAIVAGVGLIALMLVIAVGAHIL